jgi:hypothetical protein
MARSRAMLGVNSSTWEFPLIWWGFTADQCYYAKLRFIALGYKSFSNKSLHKGRGDFWVWGVPKTLARFRVSIKDHKSGDRLKVELIEAPGAWSERRYRIRINGRNATKIPEGTLTEVFDRLRRWMVKRG